MVAEIDAALTTAEIVVPGTLETIEQGAVMMQMVAADRAIVATIAAELVGTTSGAGAGGGSAPTRADGRHRRITVRRRGAHSRAASGRMLELDRVLVWFNTRSVTTKVRIRSMLKSSAGCWTSSIPVRLRSMLE